MIASAIDEIENNSRGNPIAFVQGVEGREGDTTPLGVIELPQRFRDKPAVGGDVVFALTDDDEMKASERPLGQPAQPSRGRYEVRIRLGTLRGVVFCPT